ncbi:MAG: hypothetical protein AB8B91_12950 [Rubripirellula sp.]
MFLSALLFSTVFAGMAEAHFPWVTINEEGQAVYFFGETPADRAYKLPESIAKATVDHISKDGSFNRIEMAPNQGEDFVGLSSTEALSMQTCLASKVTYGVYHGSRLDYFTQHCGGQLPRQRGDQVSLDKQLELNAELIDTDSGVDVFIRRKGEPLVAAEVRLFCADGEEEGVATTDAIGKVSFSDKQVEHGLNGILVGYTSEHEAGTLGAQAYGSVSRYLTATFLDPQDFDAKVGVHSDRYPAVPEMVTSFGAATAGDALYLYGGHTGPAHEYYAEAQASTLRRLDLKNPKSWEDLGNGPRLQGLAMVSHGGKLYRMGGFTAKNTKGEDKDLWSQAGVSCFDTATKQWTEMPSLPEPRSSFDAVVHGNQIIVVGGWKMQGDEEAQWMQTACKLDLSTQPLQWKSLPTPPFQRRALSVAAQDGKVYAIGGMQKEGGPTTRVDVLDLESSTWKRGPDLNGAGMDGFGSSSFSVGGSVYVTTYSGTLQKLASDGDSWETMTQLDNDRFFHRLLPVGQRGLLIVGGASMSSGKYEEIELIELP